MQMINYRVIQNYLLWGISTLKIWLTLSATLEKHILCTPIPQNLKWLSNSPRSSAWRMGKYIREQAGRFLHQGLSYKALSQAIQALGLYLASPGQLHSAASRDVRRGLSPACDSQSPALVCLMPH